MMRAIIAGIVTAAVALAIAVTFREYDWVLDGMAPGWRGPDFIAPGAKLPEADFEGWVPPDPVIHVSEKWVKVSGKRVVSADEVISDPDYVIESLHEEIVFAVEGRWDRSCALSRWNTYLKVPISGDASGNPRGVIIQADEGVEFGLLRTVLYNCHRANCEAWRLAAVNGESGALEVVTVHPLFLRYPWPEGLWGVGAGPVSGISPALTEREGVSELDLEYGPIPEIEGPLGEDIQYAVVLYVGEGWFLLPDREAGATLILRDDGDGAYTLLAEKLKRIKRRYPDQRCLIIVCTAGVEYEELIRVLEVSVQPEIALTEIYLDLALLEEKQRVIID
ncbi:MAG: hypothetical protein PVH29_10105 [Candidatus Zixiibacteriota bacterium]|jgi:hypothetical protein